MDAPGLTRNRWAFAVGTVGRDMVYSLMALFLIVFLSEVLDVDNATLVAVNAILLGARIFDAFTDLLMGGIVDNTRTRWGRHKPWIAVGALLVAALTVLLFADLGLRGPAYVASFAVVYVAWGLAFTMNDIGYWSLLPALTPDQVERERISALTKVFATVGLFTTVVGIQPLTAVLGGDARAWTLFAVGVSLVMLAGVAVTVFGVRERRDGSAVPHVPLVELWHTLRGNDQLLWAALSMVLFLTGYNTTTSFGVYFFKYAYRDESVYAVFALILGVGQLLGFLVYPLLRRRLARGRLYALAMALITLGYVVFYLAPMDILPIGAAGLLLFVGAAFVAVVMISLLTDCVEYGELKLGRRSAAATFAVQPFVNKVGGALATAVVGQTLVWTGINEAATPDAVTDAGVAGLRVMMLFFPLALMLLGYGVYLARFRIDEAEHARIVAALAARNG